MNPDSLKCPFCGAELEFGDKAEMSCDGCHKPVKKDECSVIAKRGNLKTDCRLDVRDIEWDYLSTKFTDTPEGYLRGRACVTTVGVFPYKQDGSIVKELRLREDVFAFDSLQTLVMKPVTNGHPKEAITAENIKKYAIGMTGSAITHDEDRVYVDLTITDPDAIIAIKNGRKALSCGYKRDAEDKAGNHNGSDYDLIQHKIEYNHLALVDRARAGDDAVIRLDGTIYTGVNDSSTMQTQENHMVKLNLDGVDHEVDEALAKSIDALRVRADSADSLKGENSKLLAERDAAISDKTKLDGELVLAKEQLASAPAKIKAQIEERSNRISSIRALGVELKGDEDDLGMKKAVIAVAHPKMVLDGKDEAYVSAMYDISFAALTDLANADKSNKEKASTKNDGEDKAPADPRQAYVEFLSNAHKNV